MEGTLINNIFKKILKLACAYLHYLFIKVKQIWVNKNIGDKMYRAWIICHYKKRPCSRLSSKIVLNSSSSAMMNLPGSSSGGLSAALYSTGSLSAVPSHLKECGLA